MARDVAIRPKRSNRKGGSLPAPGESGLSSDQHLALFGEGPDGPAIAASISVAATGLSLLASRHLARRLVAKRGPAKLTAKDQIALKLAPSIAAEVKRRTPPGGADAPRVSTGDPIADLVDGDGDGDEETRTVRISTPPK